MKLPLLLLSAFCLAALADDKPAAADPDRKQLEKLAGFQPAPPDPSAFNLHFEILVIAVPDEDALALAQQMREPAGFEAAMADLSQKLADKKAKLLGLASAITKSGQRTVSENIDEVRYPIEFESPRLQKIGPKFEVIPEEEAKPDAPPVPAPADDRPSEVLAALPTTFETRNVGLTIELEATLDPATLRLDVQLATQRVVFRGFANHTVTVGNTATVVEQPRFSTNKVSTQLTFRNGERVLLGTFKTPEHEGWTEFHIIRAAAQLLN